MFTRHCGYSDETDRTSIASLALGKRVGGIVSILISTRRVLGLEDKSKNCRSEGTW